MNNKSALLIIDAQVNMFDESMPIYLGDKILYKLERLIQQARSLSIPIIFVRHDGGEGEVDEFGTEGWQIHPQLGATAKDIFIEKKTPNAFNETKLNTTLQELGVNHLVVAGMQTDYCVNATVRQAKLQGYEVTLVSDTHSTFDSDDQTASEIIAEHNVNLTSLVELKVAEDIEF